MLLSDRKGEKGWQYERIGGEHDGTWRKGGQTSDKRKWEIFQQNTWGAFVCAMKRYESASGRWSQL